MDENEKKKQERLEKVDQLTDLILNDLVNIAKTGAMTSADRKLVLDFLTRNGLELDPRKVTETLGGLITSRVKFDDPDDGVIPLRRNG